jgi:hypothetical protein
MTTTGEHDGTEGSMMVQSREEYRSVLGICKLMLLHNPLCSTLLLYIRNYSRNIQVLKFEEKSANQRSTFQPRRGKARTKHEESFDDLTLQKRPQ